ncbi:hypothetical protein [Neobacillus sp. Marseille-QA0830]
MACQPCEENSNKEQSLSNLIFAPVTEDMLTGERINTEDAQDMNT